MRLLQRMIAPVKDFLFTAQCFHCGNDLADDENRICMNCWRSLTPVHTDDHTYCVMVERFAVEGIVDRFVPLYYFEKGKVLQHLAHFLKYDEITALGFELGTKIGEDLQRQGISADAIIPVPLNKRKERERGYNQSDCIAQGVSRVLNIPVFPHAVKRVKYTVTQTHLNADQRKENVADAFSIRDGDCRVIHDAAIVLVDDIITTGSTIQEIARVLKENGARTIIAASAGLAKLGEDT